MLRAVQAIERSDVALVLIDAAEGLADGDKRVAGYAHEAGRAVVLVVNKWDTMKGSGMTMHRFAQDIRKEMPFLALCAHSFRLGEEPERRKRDSGYGDTRLSKSCVAASYWGDQSFDTRCCR